MAKSKMPAQESKIPVLTRTPATTAAAKKSSTQNMNNGKKNNNNNQNNKQSKKKKSSTLNQDGDRGMFLEKSNKLQEHPPDDDQPRKQDEHVEKKSENPPNLDHVVVDDDDESISPIQNLFLWAVSAIYLFAFISFYHQIRGLYGNKGVLPLRYYAMNFVDTTDTFETALDKLDRSAPSLVWRLATKMQWSLTTSLEVVALLGIVVSFLQLLYDFLRGPIYYSLLFVLYYSCLNVGQTFLHFQWDTFLLETGALTILISIRSKQSDWLSKRLKPYPPLVLWTARWLLFKFMFSSGVVKLTHRCPIWWSLSALDVHFESQPLPTPLAWYAHHLPKNWLHLAVAIHFVIEIVGPFLFFTPFKSLKILSFASQVFLQVSIMMTGNYNFFNLLTIVLCLTLLDDDMFRSKPQNSRLLSPKLEVAIFGIVLGMIHFYTVHYFDVHFTSLNWSDLINGPSTKINFTYDQFNLFVINAVTLAMIVGCVSFCLMAAKAFYRCFTSGGSLFGRTVQMTMTSVYVTICAIILALSMVPLAELDTTGYHMKTTVPMQFIRWYRNAQQHHLMSSYGLFRTMTGDGGRPELIIEGSNNADANDGWRPYYFKYKPVDLYEAPTFLIPHQPRLDWQMWFAALGDYQQNPWLINLCYRLMTGSPEVIDLLDKNRLPFQTPPKFLRISRYLYKFTDTRSDRAWWKKATNRHAYLPMVTKETLLNALKLQEMKIPKVIDSLSKDRQQNIQWLLDLRYWTVVQGFLSPTISMWIGILVAIVLNRSNR